jgi:hypothetical protein
MMWQKALKPLLLPDLHRDGFFRVHPEYQPLCLWQIWLWDISASLAFSPSCWSIWKLQHLPHAGLGLWALGWARHTQPLCYWPKTPPLSQGSVTYFSVPSCKVWIPSQHIWNFYTSFMLPFVSLLRPREVGNREYLRRDTGRTLTTAAFPWSFSRRIFPQARKDFYYFPLRREATSYTMSNICPTHEHAGILFGLGVQRLVLNI